MAHILVVEDSPTQATRLCADLQAAGFDVSLAADGPNALLRLKETAVDVIASDVVMPGMTGYELCRKVKDDPRTRDITVVLLTSLTDPLEVVNALEAGADNFLRKPYDFDQLVSRLGAAVSNRQLRRAGRVQVGVQLSFLDREFDITADRRQILDLLISTFEDLVVTSRAVRLREEELAIAQEELQRQFNLVVLERQRLRAVVDAVPVPLFVTGSNGLVSHASEASARVLHTDIANILGNTLNDVADFVSADGSPISSEFLPHQLAARDGQPQTRGEAFDLFVVGPDGARTPVVLHASPIHDEFGRPAGCVSIVHAVGGLTQHDAQTGLPNAATFLDRASGLLGNRDGKAGLLILELDRFDVTQASLPAMRRTGVITEVVARLRSIFELSAESELTSRCQLASFGGHRFGVLLTNITDSFRVVHLADSARRAIAAAPVDIAGTRLTASIGIALDDGEQSGPMLFAAANAALRHAQEQGGNRVEILGEAEAKQAMGRLQLEVDLRAAVDADETSVHFQPEYDLATGAIVGFETLARWQHPRLGNIEPLVFITLAEQSGLIFPLGLQILRKACAAAQSWCEFAGPDRLTVAVNVSVLQLRPGFDVEVTTTLNETGLAADQLMLEVTETAALSNPATVVPIIEKLRALGVRFALDDFGTGYSSLTQLTRIDFDQLKLDRSFVGSIHLGGSDAIIARSIIALGASLDIPVLAEGVETEEQAQVLRDLGCPLSQGYLFSGPLPEEQVAGFLRERLEVPAAQAIAVSPSHS